MRTFDVADIAAFHAALQELRDELRVHHTTMRLWFRGQARDSWKLLPGLYRPGALVPPQYERELTRDFRSKSPPFLSSVGGIEREMFLMQHYGLPTRLLDWTTNPQAALYFAVEQASGESSVVWVLSPWKLNEIYLKRPTVPTAANPVFRHYILAKYDQTSPAARLPVAITAVHHDERIRAQDSTFTVHGSERVPLEAIRTTGGESPLVGKIRVSPGFRGFIKRELYDVGVQRGRLFPDLTGVASEIAYRYSADYFAPDESAPAPLRMETTETAISTVTFPRLSFDELAAQHLPSAGVIPPVSSSSSGMPSSAPSEDVDTAARQLAQTLVMQIKQHNPAEVEAGRKNGDLHHRLKNEIDHARHQFEDQIGEVIGNKGHYFDEQLIQVLADGDSFLLKL